MQQGGNPTDHHIPCTRGIQDFEYGFVDGHLAILANTLRNTRRLDIRRNDTIGGGFTQLRRWSCPSILRRLPGLEVLIDPRRHLAAFGDRPDDKGGAALGVAAGKDPVEVGHEVLVR